MVEFVAFGMASEVVVVVQNEDTGFRSDLLLEVVGGGQTADPAAHHHQVVTFAGVTRVIPRLALDELVSYLVRSFVTAAHSGPCWRVVSGRPLRGELLARSTMCLRPRVEERTADRHADAADEITSADGPIHA